MVGFNQITWLWLGKIVDVTKKHSALTGTDAAVRRGWGLSLENKMTWLWQGKDGRCGQKTSGFKSRKQALRTGSVVRFRQQNYLIMVRKRLQMSPKNTQLWVLQT